MWLSVAVHEHWPVSQRMIVEMGDYAWSEHIVTVFLACQITIRNVQVQLTCSTKELSIHLTKILSAVKEGQQKYCETVYSRSGIYHMWILKNSKDLSLRYPPSKLLIFQLYIPPYRMTN